MRSKHPTIKLTIKLILVVQDKLPSAPIDYFSPKAGTILPIIAGVPYLAPSMRTVISYIKMIKLTRLLIIRLPVRIALPYSMMS